MFVRFSRGWRMEMEFFKYVSDDVRLEIEISPEAEWAAAS
jgi:hypothetical protein